MHITASAIPVISCFGNITELIFSFATYSKLDFDVLVHVSVGGSVVNVQQKELVEGNF